MRACRRGGGLLAREEANELLAEDEENRWTGEPPVPAQPQRLKYLMYGFAEMALDTSKRLHGVHPDQNKNPGGVPEGYSEMRLPGGSTGMKRTMVRRQGA